MDNRISHQHLLEVLDYDSISGVFTWKIPTARKIKIGMVAGTKNINGYYTVCIYNTVYYLHILAWFYIHAEWPNSQLDHKDRDKTNNRITNLRLASNKENSRNTVVHCDNLHGYKGVATNRKKFSAKIYIDGKNKHLGSYATAKEAAQVYDQAAIEYFGEFAVTNHSLGLI